MHDVSCILLNKKEQVDEIGVLKPSKIEEIEIPIIKIESIYANEFYEANQAGYQPTLRLRISALNYNNESELKYQGITYTIIRIDETYPDEITLICERKIKNVQSNQT